MCLSSYMHKFTHMHALCMCVAYICFDFGAVLESKIGVQNLNINLQSTIIATYETNQMSNHLYDQVDLYGGISA